MMSRRSHDRGTLRPVSSERPSRRFPVLTLLSLILLVLSSGSGIALSVLIVRFKLETGGDFASRVLLFVASCMAVVYNLLHLVAARKSLVKSNVAPQVAGEYVYALALLIARLSIPVWIAAVITTALVAGKIGLDLSRGVRGNVPWLTSLVSVSALLSSSAVLFCVECSDRPFATLGLSPRVALDTRAVSTINYFRQIDDSQVQLVGRPEKEAEDVLTASNVPMAETVKVNDEGIKALQDNLATRGRNRLSSVEHGDKKVSAAVPDRTRGATRGRSRSQPPPNAVYGFFPPIVPPSRGPIRPSNSVKRPTSQGHKRLSVMARVVEEEDDERSLITKRGSLASTLSDIPSRRATVEVRASDLIFGRWSVYGPDTMEAETAFIEVPKPEIVPRSIDEQGVHHTRRGSRVQTIMNFSRPRTAPATVVRESAGTYRQSQALYMVRGADKEDMAQLQVLTEDMRILGEFPRPPAFS